MCYLMNSYQIKIYIQFKKKSIADIDFISWPLQTGASMVQRPLSHCCVLGPIIV